MKLFRKIVLILICIPILFFVGFYVYDFNHNYKFEQIKENMKIGDARNIVGKPDESKYFGNEIMDVYYYFPLAEARFFYSKSDSTLIRSWRTDAD
ncbi:hypothetical protein LUD75_05765 [Epilithonimonas sp. JDS]|uniref:hypothetical protein n=1 Tax=Epilithonimonas sp. JDS TaxID=2902797 RepID=UPI001E38A981|nr:hypothetical protein [Epilithonimonas sp. JDS]MCD9854200.1 hypothetical protein [Epilithonimonas sp. JDS]